MKLPAASQWQRPALRQVLVALAAAGGKGWLVGGAVRDALRGLIVGEIDLATTLLPALTMQALERAGLRALPTGLSHGTITALVDGETYEITTLRADMATDGRHALVAYTDDLAVDAARRDFTINALYADAAGLVLDPLGSGLADLAQKNLSFIGDPAARVTEDALRILRLYRFAAQLPDFAVAASARAACRALAGHLAILSGERLQHEWRRLLVGPACDRAVAWLVDDGLLSAQLPDWPPPTVSRLQAWREWAAPVDWRLRLLVAFAWDVGRMGSLADRFKLGNEDRAFLLTRLQPSQPLADVAAVRAAIYRYGNDYVRDRLWLAAPPVPAPELVAVAEQWQAPKLPITGHDLRQLGLAEGPLLGKMLRRIEEWWLGQDMQPDATACHKKLQDEMDKMAGSA